MSVFVMALGVLFSAVPAMAESGRKELPADPEAILSTVSSAGRKLDYHGVFTYEFAGVLKSVEVTHIARDGLEHERWFYLNGPRQEILRKGPFCGGMEGNLDRVVRPVVSHRLMSDYYDLQLWGEDRIADRAVWVLHLVPRDVHRYGFVFAVDQESGLLLQSMLLDASHRVLERFQFMSVHYGVDSDTASELVQATEMVQGEKASEHPAECRSDPPDADASAWQTEWLPPGFRLMSRSQENGDIESLLFSDGLAVFSVFFDGRDSERLPEVQAQRGATVAQLARIKAKGRNYLVSVVGEIPLETAQRVAGFVRYGAVE